MLLLELPIVNWITKKSLPEHQIAVEVEDPPEVAPFSANSLGTAQKRPSVSSLIGPFCRQLQQPISYLFSCI